MDEKKKGEEEKSGKREAKSLPDGRDRKRTSAPLSCIKRGMLPGGTIAEIRKKGFMAGELNRRHETKTPMEGEVGQKTQNYLFETNKRRKRR